MARRYRSLLREDQAAMTRERILDAAHDLLRTIRPVDLSFAAVAEAAGTSTRTVYRHFPNADDLFLALSDRLLARLLPDGAYPTELAPSLEILRRQFHLLEEDPALFRVFFAVPTRSRIGQDVVFRKIFRAWLTRVPEAHHVPILGIVDLLGSPYAWDVLHANWGLDAEQAWRAVVVAIRAFLDQVADHPETLAPPEEP